MKFPSTLKWQGHTLQFSGNGQEAGSVKYVDLAWSHPCIFHQGRVVITGPMFSQVELVDNRRVKVAHGVLQNCAQPGVGDAFLVYLVISPGQLPRAQAAWRISSGASRPAQPVPQPNPAPKPQRSRKPILLNEAQPAHRASQPPQFQPTPKPTHLNHQQPAPDRHLGKLVERHATWGLLLEQGSRELVFVHRHQMMGFFDEGVRVSYRRAQNGSRPCAADVMPA